MGDFLSVSTDTARLLAAGIRAYRQLDWLFGSVKSVSSEIHALAQELQELFMVLRKLEKFLKNETCDEELLSDLEIVHVSCLSGFLQLGLLVNAYQFEKIDGGLWRNRKLKSLEMQMAAIKDRLEAHKVTFGIVILLGRRSNTKALVTNNVKTIEEAIREAAKRHHESGPRAGITLDPSSYSSQTKISKLSSIFSPLPRTNQIHNDDSTRESNRILHRYLSVNALLPIQVASDPMETGNSNPPITMATLLSQYRKTLTLENRPKKAEVKEIVSVGTSTARLTEVSVDHLSPARDRWARIRQNAAERARFGQGSSVPLGGAAANVGSDEGSDQESMEVRVARIRARIAALTMA